MNNYSKIFKWIMWALVIVSVALLVWGFAKGYPAVVADDNGTVDPLLWWAYAMVGLAVFCVVVIGVVIAALNNPKSLVKMGLGIVAIAVVCAIAYFTAPGSPAVGIIGDQPAANTLKLTDTILNLTYFVGGLSILAIIAGEIVSSVRNK